MEKKVYDLQIDPELEKVAPPLSDPSFHMLEENIKHMGCISPLDVWNGIIVDGHNRYNICRKYGIPFEIREIQFDSKTEAKLWIVRNQVGRRNLNEYQCCEMVYPLEKEIKDAAKHKKSGVPTLAPSGKTRDVMADMVGVSHGTWDKAKFIIEFGDEKDKEELRKGKAKIHTVFKRIKDKEDSQDSHESKGHRPDGKIIPTEEPIVAANIDEPIPFEPVQKTSLDYFKNYLEEALRVLQEIDVAEQKPELFEVIDSFEKTVKAILSGKEYEK